MPIHSEMLVGATVLAAVSTVAIATDCHAVTSSAKRRCPVCEGRGRFISGGGIAASFTVCPCCKGSGEITVAEDACERCGGGGQLLRTEQVPGTSISVLKELPCPDCKGSGRKKH